MNDERVNLPGRLVYPVSPTQKLKYLRYHRFAMAPPQDSLADILAEEKGSGIEVYFFSMPGVDTKKLSSHPYSASNIDELFKKVLSEVDEAEKALVLPYLYSGSKMEAISVMAHFAINGKMYPQIDLSTPLEEGDRVDVLYFISGG
jgi:hypothetical protein